MPLVGAPRLQHLCVALLIDFRDCLEDVGDTPVELLQPVLLRCNAEQLASIEDCTRNGGRELHEALQPHWQRVYTAEFGSWNRASLQGTIHVPDSTQRVSQGVTRDWRQLYELAQQALQDKAAGLGKRLRAMTQAEVQSRQTRNVEIIEAPPSLKKHRSSNSRGPSKPKVQVIPARQRVLSKLGLLHSSSLKQLVQIRPSKLPGQHGAAANNFKPKHHIVRGMDSRQQPISPHQAAVKHHAQVPQAATAPKPSPVQTQSVIDPASHHGQRCDNNTTVNRGSTNNKQQDSTAQAPALALKGGCSSSGQLVEDDIDWGASEAAQTRAAAPPPVAEQPWTIQYLEGHDEDVDAARDQMLGRHLSQSHSLQGKSLLSPGSNISSISRGKAPVKHGTGAASSWVEDEIEWD